MRIFPRNRQAVVESPKTEADPVRMRFLTHGGATVTLTSSDDRYHTYCLGCDWQYSTSYADNAREKANAHAGECRAMPKPGVAQ